MQPVTLPVIPEPPDRVEVVIRWAASMGLDTNALVLRRATREVVALPEAQLVVRIAAARAANVVSATREVAAGRLLAQAGVPAERLAPVGLQPLRLGAAVATVWGLVPRTGPSASPAQIGVLARRLHDATEGVARHASAHIFDPLGAIRAALGEARRRGAPTGAIGEVATRALRLKAAWASAVREDPLGCALVHGDLHAGNTMPAADGPVLVDLELCGIGPRSYDLAPAAVAARRYGAPASDVDSLVDGYGDDPRGWAGFETFCQVYELWATAWALSQPDPDAVAEGIVRAAALSGNTGRVWQLR